MVKNNAKQPGMIATYSRIWRQHATGSESSVPHAIRYLPPAQRRMQRTAVGWDKGGDVYDKHRRLAAMMPHI